jgi:hypothetical protein
MRDLKAVFIQQCNIEERFQLIVTVIPDIGSRALWLQKIITLLPDTNRMGFYS